MYFTIRISRFGMPTVSHRPTRDASPVDFKLHHYPNDVGLATSTPDVYASNPVVGSGGSRHIQLGAKIIW